MTRNHPPPFRNLNFATTLPLKPTPTLPHVSLKRIHVSKQPTQRAKNVQPITEPRPKFNRITDVLATIENEEWRVEYVRSNLYNNGNDSNSQILKFVPKLGREETKDSGRRQLETGRVCAHSLKGELLTFLSSFCFLVRSTPLATPKLDPSSGGVTAPVEESDDRDPRHPRPPSHSSYHTRTS
ncbi:hypothetical protein KC19_4G028100 [Ceratodon purpureus]|uniref:Uncharacterized protein n=1 Tax=Ceratodon purpureus TaxID=3225 RepID=A0A8T0I5W0_CERPU|nr:hypothetical protein KC19_4G028100 [Ceratodon purpureus]